MSEQEAGATGTPPEGAAPGPSAPPAAEAPSLPSTPAAAGAGGTPGGPGAAPAQPGRPPRTTNGLIGAMVITLLLIGVFVALRAFSRSQPDIKPQPVDYLAAARAAHDAGHPVVYPAPLPGGWIATSFDYVPGDHPAWGVGMLTGRSGGAFVGVRQEDAPLDELLATYVDANPVKGAKIRVPGSVAPTWQEYADSGGDHAFVAQVRGDEVLVYGSAPVADLRRVVGLLTVARP